MQERQKAEIYRIGGDIFSDLRRLATNPEIDTRLKDVWDISIEGDQYKFGDISVAHIINNHTGVTAIEAKGLSLRISNSTRGEMSVDLQDGSIETLRACHQAVRDMANTL